MKSFHAVIAALLVMTAAARGAAGDFRDWVRHVLGLPAGGLTSLTRGRDCANAATGDTVRVLECPSRGPARETVVWSCGACWTPVSLANGDIAVLRADGIWRVPTAGPRAPTKVIEAQGLAALLGSVVGRPNTLVVVTSSGSSLIELADLDAKTLTPAPNEATSDDAKTLRGQPGAFSAAALRDGDQLFDGPSDPSNLCSRRTVFVQSLEGWGEPGPYCPPWASTRAQDDLERFEPAYHGNGIVYVSRSSPASVKARP